MRASRSSTPVLFGCVLLSSACIEDRLNVDSYGHGFEMWAKSVAR